MYYSDRHKQRIQDQQAREALLYWYKAFGIVLAVTLWMAVFAIVFN